MILLLLCGILEAGLLRGHVGQALLLLAALRRDREPRVVGLAAEIIHRRGIGFATVPNALIGELLPQLLLLAVELRVEPIE